MCVVMHVYDLAFAYDLNMDFTTYFLYLTLISVSNIAVHKIRDGRIIILIFLF